MKLIAHRGNLYGPSPYENQPSYVQAAIVKGFDVEIDVWQIDGKWYLGHDEDGTKYQVDESFLQLDGLWCHAKNDDAFKGLLDLGVHCFWHDRDTYTLTSKGVVWTYPGAINIGNSVWNQPERPSVGDIYKVSRSEIDKWTGVCSDYVAILKEIYDSTLLFTKTSNV